MSEENKTQKATHTRQARYIRFSSEEYRRIEEDEIRTGKSAQELLKETYFHRAPTAMLMTDQDRDQMANQIHKIGVNVNQIAKRVNIGFAYGFEEEVGTIRAQLTSVLQWLMAKYHDKKI